jgi:hypothetical protein
MIILRLKKFSAISSLSMGYSAAKRKRMVDNIKDAVLDQVIEAEADKIKEKIKKSKEDEEGILYKSIKKLDSFITDLKNNPDKLLVDSTIPTDNESFKSIVRAKINDTVSKLRDKLLN